MKLPAEGYMVNTLAAALTAKRIQLLGERIKVQTKAHFSFPDHRFIENFNCRSADKHDCGWFYGDADTIFFVKIINLSFQFSGQHGHFFQSVSDQVRR